MKNSTHFFGLLLIMGSVALMSVGLSSCSSSKGTLACPAFHKGNSGTFAMLRKYHHIIKASKPGKHEGGRVSAHINPDSVLLKELPAVELTDKGTASVSEEVPTRETAIEKFSKLDREERDEAKKAIASSLSKRPLLKRLALNKFAKIDAKYPAPAHHSDGGGGMGVGEILSIVAIIFAFLFPILGLILGIVSLIIINGNGGAGWARGLAIAAIIIGAILTLVVAGVIVIIR